MKTRRNIFGWLFGGIAAMQIGKAAEPTKMVLEPGQCPACRAPEDPPLIFPFNYDEDRHKGVRYVEIPKYRQLVCTKCGFHFNTVYPKLYVDQLSECLRRQAMDALPIPEPEDWGLGISLSGGARRGGKQLAQELAKEMKSYHFKWKGFRP